MEGVQFDEDQNQNKMYDMSAAQSGPRQSAMVKLVIRTGLASTERGANIILLVIMLIAFAASGMILIKTLFVSQGAKVSAPITQPLQSTR